MAKQSTVSAAREEGRNRQREGDLKKGASRKGRGAYGSLAQELLKANLYKRSQGKITRQITGIVLFAVFALGAKALWEFLGSANLLEGAAQQALRYGLTAFVAIGGAWFSFRVVNYPKFADFLIAVEAEMNKVSWPTRSELIRASMVVILLIIAMAALLFMFDLFWLFFFELIGVRQKPLA